MARILVIEDDIRVSCVVEEALKSQNYIVDVASDGTHGLEFLMQFDYDLAVIDWSLPGMTGYDLCKQYRKSGGRASVLFLTGKTEMPDRVQALDAGADDYLTKPFHFAELLARVRALLRRANIAPKSILQVGHVELDLNSCTAKIDGTPVTLAANEYQLLELFMKNPGRVYSSEELLAKLFDSENEAGDEAVRQRILRLRKKIDIEGRPSVIKTVKGLGYSLETGQA